MTDLKEKLSSRESPMGMSQLGKFQSCEMQWAFAYILGWRLPEDLISEPLIYGQAIHQGMEEFYKTGSDKIALNKSLSYLREVQMPDDIFNRSCEKAEDLWKVWPDVYGFEDLERYNILGIEKEGWLELPNGITISVRLDLFIRDKKTEHIFIKDIKTTKNYPKNTILDYFYKAFVGFCL